MKAISIQNFDREQKIKLFTNTPPSKVFQNPSTIKWFRKHYSDDLIKKSIYSLFPNNCEPMLNEDEVTPMSILMEWLSHYCKPEDKHKNLWINPKYFFTKEIYEKILKLKDIFLEFDEDGSRKMEIDEMVTMFKTNHIDVTEDELCSLFFKGKKYRKQDINKLYLDFYQFMQFALSKKSDYDFSMFMRKVKEKLQKEEVTTKKDDDLLNEKEPLFLPMNFNLVLDYFIKKGKERQSQKKIRRAIKRMNNIMNPGTYPENDKDFRDGDEEEEEEKEEESQHQEETKESKATKKKHNDNIFDKQLKEINTKEIMNEFEKLFNLSFAKGFNKQPSVKSFKRTNLTASNNIPPLRQINKFESASATLVSSTRYEEEKNNTILSSLPGKNNMFFTNLIMQQMEKKRIDQITKKNYSKYKSIQLARNATQKELHITPKIVDYRRKEKQFLPYIYGNNVSSCSTVKNSISSIKKCNSSSNISVKTKPRVNIYY